MITTRTWRHLLLVCGLLLPCLVGAQSAHLAGADEIISRAKDLAAKQNYDGAVSLLKSALDRYPTYPPLYFTLADLQEEAALEKLSEPVPATTPGMMGPYGTTIPGGMPYGAGGNPITMPGGITPGGMIPGAVTAPGGMTGTPFPMGPGGMLPGAVTAPGKATGVGTGITPPTAPMGGIPGMPGVTPGGMIPGAVAAPGGATGTPFPMGPGGMGPGFPGGMTQPGVMPGGTATGAPGTPVTGGGYQAAPGVVAPDGLPYPPQLIGPDGNPLPNADQYLQQYRNNTRKMATRDDLLKHPEYVRDILETYGRAAVYLSDLREVRQRVQPFIENGLPLELGTFGPMAMPSEVTAFSFTLSDSRLLPDVRGAQEGLITTQALPVPAAYQKDPKYGKDAKYARDPKYGGWTFQRIMYGYTFDRAEQIWKLQCRVIWQDVPGKAADRLQFAQQTAQMMLRLSATVKAYTGLSPRFADDGAINVWVAEKGDAGAEAYNESIYIYSVGSPRAGMDEWARELAHEYGHQTLPPVGGYDQPEWGANGLLGERLFLRWIANNRDANGNDAHPWIQAIDTKNLDNQIITPLIKKYADVGPYAPILQDKTPEAMDTFIGLALYLDAVRSSQYLTGVLSGMSTPGYAGTNGFRQSMENLEIYVQSVEHPVVTLRLSKTPSDMPYRIFLRNGNWQGQLYGEGIIPNKLKLTLDGEAVPVTGEAKFTLENIQAGWHVLRLTPIGDAPIPNLSMIRMRWEAATAQ